MNTEQASGLPQRDALATWVMWALLLAVVAVSSPDRDGGLSRCVDTASTSTLGS